MSVAVPAAEAHNLYLHPGATVGEGVTFGINVIVHDGVVLEDGVTVQDGAILGKLPKLAPTSSAPALEENRLVVGRGTTICAQAIVFAGTSIGERCIIGDQSLVRERAVIGDNSVVGRGSSVDNDVRIGSRVRIQSQVYVTAFSVVEDDVFLGPCAMTTNDDTMNRHDSSYALQGATIRRAARVGGGSVLTPGVEVGEEAFIAAGAVVTKDVAPRELVLGVPARKLRAVDDDELLERWR